MSFKIEYNPSTSEALVLPVDCGEAKDVAAAKAKFAKALVGMDSVRKDAKNPAFKSTYARLSSVLEVVGNALDPHCLALTSTEINIGSDKVKMSFVITDAQTGASFVAGFSSSYRPEKVNAQGTGSAESYAIRRGLMAVFGIATEDDDGHAASFNTAPNRLSARPVGEGQESYTPPGPAPAPRPIGPGSARPPGM